MPEKPAERQKLSQQIAETVRGTLKDLYENGLSLETFTQSYQQYYLLLMRAKKDAREDCEILEEAKVQLEINIPKLEKALRSIRERQPVQICEVLSIEVASRLKKIGIKTDMTEVSDGIAGLRLLKTNELLNPFLYWLTLLEQSEAK